MNFRKVQTQTYFWVSSIPNHAEVKPMILSAINTVGEHGMVEKAQKIFNTDWHLDARYPRTYWNIVFPLLAQHHKAIEDTFISNETMRIQNYWFQQYRTGDYHNWHTHDTAFSNIYYVSLPENSYTTFICNDQEFTVEVNEGDLLTFPSVFQHCSKPNQNDAVKTIVSYNSYLA